jgi:hypothetical protein
VKCSLRDNLRNPKCLAPMGLGKDNNPGLRAARCSPATGRAECPHVNMENNLANHFSLLKTGAVCSQGL